MRGLSCSATSALRHALRTAAECVASIALAIIAVNLVWTESEHLRLGSTLARSAAANAAYPLALRLYWTASPEDRVDADRDVLSPARRQVGLANTESEEALERLMMERGAPSEGAVSAEHAFAFATYSRRFTQNVTTIAILHPTPPNPQWNAFVDDLQIRLQRIAGLLEGKTVGLCQLRAILPPGEEQGQGVQLRRQVEVLEKSALGAVPR